MNSKLVDTPMDPNTKLLPNQGEFILDPESNRRLVGNLNDLTLTRLTFPLRKDYIWRHQD